MKIDDSRSLVERIRDASFADVAIVSVILLSILLPFWMGLIFIIGLFPETTGGIRWLVGGLILAYVLAVASVQLTGVTRSEKLRAVRHIRDRIAERPAPYNSIASFDYIRRNVNETYTDEFLGRLITEFPDLFERARCTDGGKSLERPGIKLKIADGGE